VDSDEPATNLLTQGMVIADTFYREDADGARNGSIRPTSSRARRAHGRITGATRVAVDGLPVLIGGTEKMSKSKNNGVDPQAGGQVRCRHRAPVLDVRRAAGAVAGMERSRRGGHGALPAPLWR
jgi:hypothetical protein